MDIALIAGKTANEILSWKRTKRCRWYKTILLEEKEEAMQIVEVVRRNKNRIYMINRIVSEETKIKISASKRGKNHPFFGKSRPQHSEFMRGKNNPSFGIIRSEETKAKNREAAIERWKNLEYRNSMTGENHPMYGKMRGEDNPAKRPEVRAKISMRMAGEKNPSFNNWASRLPYCYKWNEPLREEVRNRWERRCVLSDTLRSAMGPKSVLDDFEGHEIFSGRRLSVHHIRGDKMEGCNGTEMALIPLQGKFNNKKIDGLKLENHLFYITLFLLKDIERKHREESWR